MTKNTTVKRVKKVGDFVESPSRADVESYLAEIGWSIRHHGQEHYLVYNHKGKHTDLQLIFPDTDARLELSQGYPHDKPSCVWYLKDLRIEMLDDCVSFRGKRDENIFILCPNYDTEKEVVSLKSPKKRC